MSRDPQKRGAVTTRIKESSLRWLGYEIDTTELRLMPYIQYVMMNDQHLDPHKCNEDDREILSKWREAGHIEGGVSGLAVTREFWYIICDLCFLAYVDIDH